MADIRIAERRSTVAWEGDVLVLGGGLEGMTAALACADEGHSVCILENGPTLGREVSREWTLDIPDGRIARRVEALCQEQGVPDDGSLDVFTATLAFDRIVEENGITALVRVQPLRPIRSEDGNLVGVEIVGKSGRQLVRAETVIDATPARRFSRRTLDEEYPDIALVERRMYLHGVDGDTVPGEISLPEEFGTEGDRVKIRPAAWPGEVILAFELRQGAVASEMSAQKDSYHAATEIVEYLRRERDEFKHSNLVDVSPEIRVEYELSSIPTEPLTRNGLVVLEEGGPLEEKLDRATRVTERIVDKADRQSFPPVQFGPETREVETAELAASEEWDLPSVTLPEASAEMHDPTDVVVAGWGAGGALAALTAAEEGASVTVVDPCPLPGGIATAGRIHSYYYGREGGRQDQLDELVAGRGSALAEDVTGFHPVAKAGVLQEEISRAGVNAFSGHMAFGVVMEDDHVRAVVTAAPDGYHVFPCEVAIDGTGDGDLATAAGAETRLGRVGDGFPQPYSYTPSLVGDGTLRHHNFDAGWVDPTDTLDYSRAHFEGRDQLWRLGPFSEEHHYCALADVLGIRESRFVDGPIVLGFEDFLEGKTYPDTVCDAHAHYDNHAQDYAEESQWARHHVLMCGQWRYLCSGNVPYRALYPKDISGLLVACRALSVDHDLHQLLRMQRDMQRIGEICGLAAAESVATITPPSDVDVEALQDELGRRGIMPDGPPEGLEPSTVGEQLEGLGTAQNGLAMMRLSDMDPNDPAWRTYLENEPDGENRFCAAVAGALAGRDTADVRTELERVVEERVAEQNLGPRTPPAYVVGLMALVEIGETGIAEYVDEIVRSEDLSPPALLLLLRVLADCAEPDGVPVIREFLRRNEDNDFAHSMSGCPGELTTSYRFAIVLRAVRSLKILGCREEDGRLQEYLHSPQLLIRRHARRVAQKE